MLVKVVGIKENKFTAKDTGELVEGVTLYIEYPDNNVAGMAAGKEFIRKHVKLPEGLKPGSDVDFEYNKYGKVQEVHLPGASK